MDKINHKLLHITYLLYFQNPNSDIRAIVVTRPMEWKEKEISHKSYSIFSESYDL